MQRKHYYAVQPLQRLPTVDLEQLNRDELVKTFKSFATPIHKRPRHGHAHTNAEQREQLPGSQRSIQLKKRPEPNVEKLTDACKRIKFSNTRQEELLPKKRMHEGDTPMVINFSFHISCFGWPKIIYITYLFSLCCRHMINHPASRSGWKLHGHNRNNLNTKIRWLIIIYFIPYLQLNIVFYF